MKAAEWRASLSAYAQVTHLSPDTEALLRDFEAAEAINVIREDTIRSLQRAVRDAEARAAAFLEDAHRLSERCVAVEEERNVAEARAERERRHRRWALEYAKENHKALYNTARDWHEESDRADAAEARLQAEQQRREAAEARVRVLDPVLDVAVFYRTAYEHTAIIGKSDKEEADKAIQRALCAGPYKALSPQEPQKGASRE